MKLSRLSRAAATLGPAVVVLVFGILVYEGTQSAARSNARVDATYAVRAQLHDLFSRVTDAEAAQREFLLRGEEELVGPYRASEGRIARSLDTLLKLIVDETQRRRLSELESLVAERLFHLERGIGVRRKTGAEAAQSIVLGRREAAVMDEIRRKIEEMDQVQAKLLMQRQGAELRQARLSSVAVVAGTLLAALMALLTNVILTRYASRHERATRDVARTNEQLAAQTRELAAANAQLQKTAYELEQQTKAFAERTRLAMLNAEIGYSLTHSSSMEVMLQRATAALVAHVEAAFARIWTLNEKGQMLELQASSGMYTHLDGPHSRVLVGSFKIGTIAAEKKPHLTNKVLDDPRVSDHEWARREGMVAFAGYPLLLDGELLGVMAMFSRRELSDADFQALALAAGGVALGIQRRRADVELGRLLAEAQAARAEAERANMAKSDFLAMMSHELRTPLNAIGGYTELMQMGIHGPITQAQADALNRVKRAQTHLLVLINSVLNFAKLQAGHVEFRIARVPIHEALADLEDLIAPQARAKQLEFNYVPGPDLRTEVEADREKLQQIVINLLGNSVKFTPPGGLIQLSWESAGDVVRIQVHDTGSGIPASKLASIFDPFVQVSDLFAERQGTGLGLSISRDLARAMGGEITATSAVGVGSTFVLTLPIASDERAERETPEPASRESPMAVLE